MQFRHVARARRTQISGCNEAFLIDDNWDDYTFQTLFELVAFTDNRERVNLGWVKILSRGLDSGRVAIPETFTELDERYCSLGQEENYYEALAGLPKRLGEKILRAMRDCVNDPHIYGSFRDEKGFTTSLLRFLSEQTVTVTFPAALGGQAPLTPYHSVYELPRRADGSSPPMATFEVDPNSMPPTNVHVIIGRNGAGKTRLLGNIADAICQPKSAASNPLLGAVEFVALQGTSEPGARFSNLVTVTFSAFDPFRTPSSDAVTSGDIRYAYVGLKRDTRAPNTFPLDSEFKEHDDLVSEFEKSLRLCSSGPRLRRWHEAISTLETDPGIADLELHSLLPSGPSQDVGARITAFSSLSSGHKIVILTITRLVELVDQKTLVLIDEPEAHLHPPLLSSFVRALSNLLKRRNAVAIIATHSPVVLQETPRNCVWVLRRSGDVTSVDRPAIETFGENVGVLTREVFGLEVTASGFHKMIADKFDVFFTNYDAVIDSFGGQLGAEARAIVRALSRTVG
jgi:hypothetical protein